MPHNLALITVVYENYTVLDEFLKSLNDQSNRNFHLFICDLSDSKKTIPNTNFPTTILPAKNKGYSHGVNIGLKESMKQHYKYFCILNNDTYFNKDFVENVLGSLSKYPNSITGGKIYYAPGFEYHKTRYRKEDLGKVIWFAGGKIDWNHALTPHIGVDQVDKGQFNKTIEIDFINGALMAFDIEVLKKVGFWDENYFLYFEDADYCVRAEKSGIKLYFDPKIILWHKNAQSTGGSGSRLHIKYQKINRLKFSLKYAPIKTKIHLIKNFLLDFLSGFFDNK